MNSAIHYYTAAQRQTDVLRDSHRIQPQPHAELPPAPEPRRRRRLLLLAFGRS
jgi:hypothetical protein